MADAGRRSRLGDPPLRSAKRLIELAGVLNELAKSPDVVYVSSDTLAGLLDATSSTVRSDLSYLGVEGVRGRGYDVRATLQTIQQAMLTGGPVPVVIAGAGRLGLALLDHLREVQGLEVIAVTDLDPSKVGASRRGVPLLPADEVMPPRGMPGFVGVVAVPPAAAQDATDELVARGAVAVMNFAPVPVVASDAAVWNSNLAIQLRLLYTTGLEQRQGSSNGN